MGKRGINHYIAGACFLISVLCIVFYAFTVSTGDTLKVLMNWKYPIICYLLLAVSMFSNRPIFTIMGGTVYLFYFVYYNYSRIQDIELIAFSYPLCAVFLILTGFLGMKHKDTRIPAIIAGLLALVFFVYQLKSLRGGNMNRVFNNLGIWYKFIILFLQYFFVGIGSIVMGFAFSITEKKLSTLNDGSSNGVGSKKIEQLTKLTGLLDKGIITQEEFDKKKKQIMR